MSEYLTLHEEPGELRRPIIISPPIQRTTIIAAIKPRVEVTLAAFGMGSGSSPL